MSTKTTTTRSVLAAGQLPLRQEYKLLSSAVLQQRDAFLHEDTQAQIAALDAIIRVAVACKDQLYAQQQERKSA